MVPEECFFSWKPPPPSPRIVWIHELRDYYSDTYRGPQQASGLLWLRGHCNADLLLDRYGASLCRPGIHCCPCGEITVVLRKGQWEGCPRKDACLLHRAHDLWALAFSCLISLVAQQWQCRTARPREATCHFLLLVFKIVPTSVDTWKSVVSWHVPTLCAVWEISGGQWPQCRGRDNSKAKWTSGCADFLGNRSVSRRPLLNGRQAGGWASSVLQNQETPGFEVQEQVAHLSKEGEVEGYSSANGEWTKCKCKDKELGLNLVLFSL